MALLLSWGRPCYAIWLGVASASGSDSLAGVVSPARLPWPSSRLISTWKARQTVCEQVMGEGVFPTAGAPAVNGLSVCPIGFF